jgi:hypothetical protein
LSPLPLGKAIHPRVRALHRADKPTAFSDTSKDFDSFRQSVIWLINSDNLIKPPLGYNQQSQSLALPISLIFQSKLYLDNLEHLFSISHDWNLERLFILVEQKEDMTKTPLLNVIPKDMVGLIRSFHPEEEVESWSLETLSWFLSDEIGNFSSNSSFTSTPPLIHFVEVF